MRHPKNFQTADATVGSIVVLVTLLGVASMRSAAADFNVLDCGANGAAAIPCQGWLMIVVK